ncbi:MAG: PD-(D/E)XK nuclease family protein [Candidatus Gottesmanbacteria bacterium]|nr:PD-(D/E)XK nuclease family protein [Candidatus Gottesmanbacteria bacterium]
MKDKYSAVWVSHSSIGDYLKCPRAYFLKNIYRDPKTNHKIMLMEPPLALGQVVHEVLETLSTVPAEARHLDKLLDLYEEKWKNIHGERGGFHDEEEEKKFKDRGAKMIARVMTNPGPLANKAIKIRQELPYYWLSEDDNIILCGKIDWLEYVAALNAVRIIDFKTGKFDEDEDSLQLPIYLLLAAHCQTKPIAGASYWYLDRDDAPTAVSLPTGEDATKRVMEYARMIVLARKLERFICKQKDGCRVCRPLENIINGKSKYIGVGSYEKDIYINI